MEQSIVHLVRHGQVHNPDGVLYGRLPGYRLSDLGEQMAQRLGEHFANVELTHLRCSPLERTQQTMAPIAAAHPGLAVVLDERVIEADNVFAGKSFRRLSEVLLDPRTWWHLRNPLRPSWGEPYRSIVERMRAAIVDSAGQAAGGQAVIVSHELPIWVSRLSAEGRPLVHDPRRRQARLASVTSFTLLDSRIVRVDYSEPAGDLVPVRKSGRFRPGA